MFVKRRLISYYLLGLNRRSDLGDGRLGVIVNRVKEESLDLLIFRKGLVFLVLEI